MEPRTLVLLHAPAATAQVWGDLPALLEAHPGLAVVTVDVPGEDAVPDSTGGDGPLPATRYVAAAARRVSEAVGDAPVVLVGHRDAGPLLPMIGFARRAAHAGVRGYVFLDALLPPPGGTAFPVQWPDAPCAYLRTAQEYAPQARLARARGWPVVELDADLPPGLAGLADALLDLLDRL